MERRSTDRIKVNLTATCRVPATPHRVTVLDLSQSGCRVAIEEGTVLTGSTVHVDLMPGEKVSGLVTWTGGRQIGVKFNRRLTTRQAIDLGIHAGPPTPPTIVNTGYTPSGGGLQHWVRKIFGFGTIKKAGKAR